MTELDRKILFTLDKDARASYSDIARELGTSAQVVKYHVEKLQEDGILKHIWAFVDYDKAGYPFFWGYWLKFNGLTKEKEAEMYADFFANKFIPIVMRCDGYADAMIGVISQDVFHHNEILQSIFTKYGAYISNCEMVVGLGFNKFPRTYLINTQNNLSAYSVSGGTPEREKLSELDRKMLSLLQMDGRMEFTKMARVLRVSVGLVQKHYRKLLDKKIITKITYTPDYKKMGYVLYRVLCKIVQFDTKRNEDLYTFCAEQAHIINYVKTMGSWQLMLDIEIENREKLRDLIRILRAQFKDIIFQIEINEVYQLDKFTQMVIEYPELAKSV